MKATHLGAGDFLRQPWKNGGGVTTQLALHEEGGRWLWRLSLAEVVRSGPFSDFSGYERTIMLLEGEGMELRIDESPGVDLRTPYRPFVFDGAARTACRLLGGPVKDLNLMVDERRARARVDVIDPDSVGSVAPKSSWALAFALRGFTRIAATTVERRLAPGELLRIDEAQITRLVLASVDGPALVALVRIERTGA